MKFTRLARYTLITSAGMIILIILAVFVALTAKQDNMIRNYVHLSARSHFESILISRRWNADYGGVFVLKKAGVEFNP